MWPDNAKVAVGLTIDFDAEELWLHESGGVNVGKPGVLSQGTYGGRVAVPELLKMLDRHGVQATFFVPGRVAEHWPDRVRDIVAAGHELANHGYTHASPTKMTREQEKRELVRGHEVLSGFGAEITGYRAPSLELTVHTLDLLEELGYRYSSNMMADVRPYWHEGTSVLEIPTSWPTNDSVHWWFDTESWNKKISTSEEVRSIWSEEYYGIRDLGGACVYTTHPQIIGRPMRLRFLDSYLEFLTSQDDAWFAPLNAMTDHLAKTGYSVSSDHVQRARELTIVEA
ncbi:polysaccharide deacetylase [Streptomyces atratus]|uniref:polysaccharide deacetylase family protein n=1 Tax=Streptomyces atratus TaxID=1893 RepID=UPI00166F9142|nr:polysaccharide deacetylase [Streptomyces atratus]WPW26319.1 polysaccharide deacetylase [Streptomyces atratus]GGT65931.1 polysaccharide deacetylase [Streptomyces atratus]